eukprot:930811-Amphidinium_carterae.1
MDASGGSIPIMLEMGSIGAPQWPGCFRSAPGGLCSSPRPANLQSHPLVFPRLRLTSHRSWVRRYANT